MATLADSLVPVNDDSPTNAGSSTNYAVIINNPGFDATAPSGSGAYLQSPWRWCNVCSCLFWGNADAESWCPYDYQIVYGTQIPHDAYYSSNCRSLYWGGQWANSYCQWQVQNGIGNSGSTGYAHAWGDTVYYVAMLS